MKRMLLVSVAAAAVAGCRTNKAILDDYEKALSFGRYGEPVEEIAAKAEDGGVDELMWRLLLGSSRYLAQEWREAVCQFDLAEDLFADRDGASVAGKATDTTFAMLTNDRALPFTGTGSDRVFASLYKAIDYGANGEMIDVDNLSMDEDLLIGPRGLTLGDTLDVVLSRFRYEATGTDGIHTWLYGTEADPDHAVMDSPYPGQAELHYVLTADGQRVEMILYVNEGVLRSITLQNTAAE